MKLTLLGCGGSGGVPIAAREPGGYWGACDPAEAKNRRSRVSVLVEQEDTAVLIDTSPDLRQQILDNGILRIDAVLFTHAHADHCHGLDELRGMSHGRSHAIPAFMDETTHRLLTARFAYAFASSADPQSLYRPLMSDRVIDGPFSIGPIPVTPFEQTHGPEMSLGYRLGPVAYSTDVTELDEAAFRALEGVKVWVVDCLRYRPHPTHAHLAQSLEWIERVAPERAVLTHLNHEIDYQDLRRRCPPGVEPGYDGLVIEV